MKGTVKTSLTKYRITIRKPNGSGRKSFSLVRDVINNTSRTQSTLDLPELNTINERYLSGELAPDIALRLVMDVKDKELAKYHGSDIDQSKLFHKDNQRYVLKLLEEAGTKNIKKISLTNTEIDYNRLLVILGSSSICTIRKVDLKDALDNSPYSISVKNKLVCRLNLMLKLAGREFHIVKYPTEKHDISHIIEKDLTKLVLAVDGLGMDNSNLIKDAIEVLFYTGLREGELFAIAPKHYKKELGVYTVANQFTRDGNEQSKPKTGKTRSIAIPKKGKAAFERWMGYDKELRKSYRLRLSKSITRAAKAAFPKDTEKHVSCHDLRHSFAIWSLGKGLSLTQVAFLLGNTLSVCQHYYTGYTLSDEAMKDISKKLG